MAEVLGQVTVGIGRQIHLSRILLDTVRVFSWTIWIILLFITVDWALGKLEEHMKNS
jgi:NitT/TauT family transport system permease protein